MTAQINVFSCLPCLYAYPVSIVLGQYSPSPSKQGRSMYAGVTTVVDYLGAGDSCESNGHRSSAFRGVIYLSCHLPWYCT